MFQRALSRSSTIAASRNTVRQVLSEQYVCSTCASAASAPRFLPVSTSRIAQRHFAIRRHKKAPSTLDRESEQRRQLQERGSDKVAEEDVEKMPVARALVAFCRWNDHRFPTLNALTDDRLLAFFKEVVDIDDQARRVGSPPHGNQLLYVMSHYKVHVNCAIFLAAEVSSNYKHRNARDFVESWLHAMSETGREPAVTLTILNRALLRKEDGVDTMSKPQVIQARRIAMRVVDGTIKYGNQTYWSYMLSSIVGRIEQTCGNTDRAIALFLRAVELEPRANLETDLIDLMLQYDVYSPWQYLAELYKKRYDDRKSAGDLVAYLKYIDLGCEKGDPISHWQAAVDAREFDEENFHSPTSRWLYHCLKAAASGHLQAAYSLANFYHDSGWRYIQDDPPDRVKPTPFDHKPHKPPLEAPHVSRSFFGDVREFLRRVLTDIGSIGTFPGTKAPHEDLFHTAVYPSTAKERMRLAIEWLDVASDFNFAPAYLVKAKIHLTKTLWTPANAPAPALSLSDIRYGEIKHPREDPDNDERNPYYDISLAKDALREVFRACQMGDMKRRDDARFASLVEKHGRSRRTHDHNVYRRAFEKQPAAAKYFTDYGVWDQFADDLERLEKEAKTLCKDKGLDIYETDGMLVFRGTV